MKKTTPLALVILITISAYIRGDIGGLSLIQNQGPYPAIQGHKLYTPKAVKPFYTKTTIQVAEQLKFPALIYSLRDKAQDFIIQHIINDTLDVQALHARDLNYRASGLEYMDDNAELLMQERFDREFERIDRELLAGAQKLDREEAPFEKKAAFVKTVGTDAIESIKALIASYQQ